jgi:hypothetical protein
LERPGLHGRGRLDRAAGGGADPGHRGRARDRDHGPARSRAAGDGHADWSSGHRRPADVHPADGHGRVPQAVVLLVSGGDDGGQNASTSASDDVSSDGSADITDDFSNDFSDFSDLSDYSGLFSDFSDLSDYSDLFSDFSDFSDLSDLYDFTDAFSDVPIPGAPDAGDPVEPSEFIDEYGTVPRFDRLADSCFDGDLNDCNELYAVTPISASTNSYEGYGATCGGRLAEESPGICTTLG